MKTWKNQVENEIKKIGLKKENENDHVGNGVNGVNTATLVNGDKTGSKLVYCYYLT